MNMDAPSLRDRIDAYLDGSISEEERETLERILKSTPQARREFWRHAGLHGLLREAAQLKWSADAGPAGRTGPDAGDSETSPARGFKRIARILAAAALLITIGTVALLMLRGLPGPRKHPDDGGSAAATTAPASLAQVVRTAGCRWAQPAGGLAAGAYVGPGMLKLNAGAVELRLADGSQVIIEGPAAIELIGAGRLACTEGKVLARASPQVSRLTVVTPALTVADLGTEFGVLVLSDKPTEVHVFSGSVLVSGEGELRQGRVLSAGDALRAKLGKVQEMPARRGAFISEGDFARRAAAEQAGATGIVQ